MGATLVIPATRDPMSLESAISSMFRIYEEFEVEGVLILASSGVPREVAEKVRATAGALAGGRVAVKMVDLDPHKLGDEEPVFMLKRGIEDAIAGVKLPENYIVVISSAGKFMAASLAAACAWANGKCTAVHVHFYFGPWTGLYYPLTPRSLHPIVVVHPGDINSRESRAGALQQSPVGKVGLTVDSEGSRVDVKVGDSLLGSLPPLRGAVAELARRINDALNSQAADPDAGDCGELRVEVRARDRRLTSGAADLCNPGSIEDLAAGIARSIVSLAEMRGRKSLFSQLASWAGLLVLREYDSRAPLSGFISGAMVTVDTSLIYQGVHVDAWGGMRVAVPECSMVEVERSYAEAIKRGFIESAEDLSRLAAYLALEDLMAAGAMLTPSPPPPCDVAIPRIDRVQLSRSAVATSDDGAYRLRRRQPALQGTNTVKVYFDPRSPLDPLPRGSPERLSRAWYGLLQALILLDLASKYNVDCLDIEVVLKAGFRGSTKMIAIPSKIIIKVLGLVDPQSRAASMMVEGRCRGGAAGG